MAIIVFDEERFTDAAKETMEHMIYYVDESDPVTLLSERCAIIVRPFDAEIDGIDEILEASDRQADMVLYSMPDFINYVMDDGCGIVRLINGGARVFIPKEMIDGIGDVPLGLALECRRMGLEACDNNDIIAMFIPD